MNGHPLVEYVFNFNFNQELPLTGPKQNKKIVPNKVDFSILHPSSCVPSCSTHDPRNRISPSGTSHGIVEFVHLGAVVTSKDQHRSLMDHHTAGILGKIPRGTPLGVPTTGEARTEKLGK